MKLAQARFTIPITLMIAFGALASKRPRAESTCRPASDGTCLACKDCSSCRHCHQNKGLCSVCIVKKSNNLKGPSRMP